MEKEKKYRVKNYTNGKFWNMQDQWLHQQNIFSFNANNRKEAYVGCSTKHKTLSLKDCNCSSQVMYKKLYWSSKMEHKKNLILRAVIMVPATRVQLIHNLQMKALYVAV